MSPSNWLSQAEAWTSSVDELRPMLATLATAAQINLRDPGCVYEKKYDGLRALVWAPHVGNGDIKILSRTGNDKTHQFPDIANLMNRWRDEVGTSFVMDAEIVATGSDTQDGRFTRLQKRMNLQRKRDIDAMTIEIPCEVIGFDLLRWGDRDLRNMPMVQRRMILQQMVTGSTLPPRLSELAVGDGTQLWRRAQEEQWEGIIVKNAQSTYATGVRSPEWRKLKQNHSATFTVVGFSYDTNDRVGLNALLLAHRKDGDLQFCGGVGSGLSGHQASNLRQRLQPLVRQTCVLSEAPKWHDPVQWVEPHVSVEVKFGEWEEGRHVRHPVFVGVIETQKANNDLPWPPTPRDTKSLSRVGDSSMSGSSDEDAVIQALLSILSDLEDGQQAGSVRLTSGHTLDVSNLRKIFWPEAALTKGDLIRHYVRVASVITPVVYNRPLVMKRHPHGSHGEAFYQHRAPEVLPPGARTATLPNDDVPSRLIGGDLYTLLYMAQLGSISQDPWFSRVATPHAIDFVALDLDPGHETPFALVNDCARWIHDLLLRFGFPGFPKTSGASGLHIYIPLAPETPYAAGRVFAQILSTMIARAHPKVATVERTVSARPANTVYIDYLQNVHGKTLACAYSARASNYAGVSTPLTWKEVHDGVDPKSFNLRTIGPRLRKVGDLWAATRDPKQAVDLTEALAALQAKAK